MASGLGFRVWNSWFEDRYLGLNGLRFRAYSFGAHGLGLHI
jgi:hypothetical protein